MRFPNRHLTLVAGTLGLVAPLTAMQGAAPAMQPEIRDAGALPLGREAMSACGSIQPHGLPTRYWFEITGPEGSVRSTEPLALPPRLAAHYRETWDGGLAGWAGGLEGDNLRAVQHEGERGGYVRFTEPSGDDDNHIDGIGMIHLVAYFSGGSYYDDNTTTAYFGGGVPDFRDAMLKVRLRGRDFVANGAQLSFWAQSDNDLANQLDLHKWSRANWALTGVDITKALASGNWETAIYRISNDPRQWTYGGNNIAQRRPNYAYNSLDEAIGNLNCNFFQQILFVDPDHPPTGAIDLDEIELTYRNHSLLYPSNGGRLVSAPPGGEGDPAALTDGWRNGPGRMWAGPLKPSQPIEIIFRLESPAEIAAVQLHQHTDWPSREVEVSTSLDGTRWESLFQGAVPASHPLGPNFAFLIRRGLERRAQWIRVRILSGYQDERWGLGEVEVFGKGAAPATDDDWYNVNRDVTGLVPGRSYRVRLVAENDSGKAVSSEFIYVAPETARPIASAAVASRIDRRSVLLTGRLTPMGRTTAYYFQYGATDKYGSQTNMEYGGCGETPRTVRARVERLEPDTEYHCRLVATNDDGVSYGEDRLFRTAR